MFRHRLRLMSLLGFTVWIDASWLLLAVLIVWSLAASLFPAVAPDLPGTTYWIMGVAGLIGLALSIILHELAHALVARRYAIPMGGITLFIFGGVAEMQDEPSNPRSELLMALAGPAMSLTLAAILFGLAELTAGSGSQSAVSVVFVYLAYLNGILAVFNMIPAFPLDGGRILRAALWAWKGDILWATKIAAMSGRLFSYVLMGLGLISFIRGDVIGGVWLFVLGLFLGAIAAASVGSQVARSALSTRKVADLMRREVVTVPPTLKVDALVEDYFYRYYFKQFPVSEGGTLVGFVDVDAVKRLDRAAWNATAVDAIMRPCAPEMVVAPAVNADRALRQMQSTGRTRLLVVDADRLVGVLSLRDLMAFLSMEIELTGGRESPTAAAARAGAGGSRNPVG